ncbi:hypothetical protein [Stenotrophomonas sp.]|uniref:hypothetical protein n=1 Tax=Stenotrophomonas sp. TaxID=69392 RepID=UPI00289C973B|nr:hypothetical protein [Stenotrophomonas sp.]
MNDTNSLSAAEKKRRNLAMLGVAIFSVMGVYISGLYFIAAFLCVAFAALRRPKVTSMHAALCLGVLVMIGTYHVGKYLAKRENATQSAISCSANLQPAPGG